MKTAHNALTAHQLSEHIANLGTDGDQRLFVITPDAEQPKVMPQLGDSRVISFNFRTLSDAIEQSAFDPAAGVAERHRFLLRELQSLMADDGLMDNDNDDVAVVAARFAYREYLKRSTYICQPQRAFREGLTHIGFYANSAIQPHVPGSDIAKTR